MNDTAYSVELKSLPCLAERETPFELVQDLHSL